MRKSLRPILAAGMLMIAAGCAARRGAGAAQHGPRPIPPLAVVRLPPVPSAARLPLSAILPQAVLPAPASRPSPTTNPADDRPPLEALTLYAEACDNLLKHRRLAAITLLEKAAALDPNSYELHAALGRAYLGSGGTDARSIAAMERAAAIDPDHVELQTDLGRQYLAAGDAGKALWHLRLALNTSDYATDEAEAAVAELFAGRALARAGYHAAALEVYDRLLGRLRNPSFALRGDPEVAYLLARPDLLTLQVAESCEQVGRFEEALAAYDAAAKRDPNDFGLRARAVRALLAMGRSDDAIARAAEAVSRSDGDPAALDLLAETSRSAGREGAVAQALYALRRARPHDRGVLFALADVLRREGKPGEASDLLRPEAEANPPAAGAVRRMYECATDLDASGIAAARFLIGWSARHPDAVHLVAERWDDLIRPTRVPRVDLRTLQRITRGPGRIDDVARWEAAKWYWVAQVARLRHRQDVAREAMRRAVGGRAVFAPALRADGGEAPETEADAGRDDTNADARNDAHSGDDAGGEGDDLAARAAAAGDAALAAELRGRSLMARKRFAEARKLLDEAAALGGASPNLHFARALAARGAGDHAAFERLLWKLVGDEPEFEAAFETLYTSYASRDADASAAKVLSAWLASDRSNVTARLLQAREHFRAGRAAAGERALEALLDDAMDRGAAPRVLAFARSYYTQAGRLDAFVSRLRARLDARPADVAAAAQLSEILTARRKLPEAARVLDATRAAVADDPDLLYEVAHLYERVEQKSTTSQVLRDVLRLDPGHASAANDLGYTLADEGRELERAEALTRKAVGADPANPSFLDSLGWVLYKRGKFDEARQALARAVDLSHARRGGPDPVVLDHLGDVLYRAGDAGSAAARWKQAIERLAAAPAAAAARDDLKSLRLQLERKAKQSASGQPVSVAPVAREPGPEPVGATD
jgi:tetratricopeptide (TPR) repeat protein